MSVTRLTLPPRHESSMVFHRHGRVTSHVGLDGRDYHHGEASRTPRGRLRRTHPITKDVLKAVQKETDEHYVCFGL